MDIDPQFSVYFWIDHIVTPPWIKRSKQHQCYQCETSLSKASPHCHLCGMLFCKPCTSALHLPQRFNVKKRPFGPFSVCNGCAEQVNIRRLSILSDLAQQENSTLNNYADLPIVQYSIDSAALERGEEFDLGKVKTPTCLVESDAFSPQVTLLHSFLGVDINISVKQLYASISGTQTQQHLESISILFEGQIVPLDKLSRITIKQLLPAAYIATPEQIEAYNASNPEYPAPNPSNFAFLAKIREDKRKADKRAKRQSSGTVNLGTISEGSTLRDDGAVAAAVTVPTATIVTDTGHDSNSSTEHIPAPPPAEDNQDIAQNEKDDTFDPDSTNTRRHRSERSQSRSVRDPSRSRGPRTRDASVSHGRREKEKEKEKEKAAEEGAWYMAMHTYVNAKPQAADAKSKVLSFSKSDKLRITNQANADWWYATTEDGTQKGWIPAAYLLPLEEALKKMKTKKPRRLTGSAA